MCLAQAASEVTVMSDFGVLRKALDKLTAATRGEVMKQSKPNTDSLLRCIEDA